MQEGDRRLEGRFSACTGSRVLIRKGKETSSRTKWRQDDEYRGKVRVSRLL
jgi:hypothetical protein